MAIDKINQNKILWLDEVVSKVKAIEAKWVLDTFIRYRECGQVIIASGYLSGKWHSNIKEEFLERTEYGDTTFKNMVRLGKMSEDEFDTTSVEFKSYYSWKQKQKQLPEEIEDRIDVLREELKAISIEDVEGIVAILDKFLEELKSITGITEIEKFYTKTEDIRNDIRYILVNTLRVGEK